MLFNISQANKIFILNLFVYLNEKYHEFHSKKQNIERFFSQDVLFSKIINLLLRTFVEGYINIYR